MKELKSAHVIIAALFLNLSLLILSSCVVSVDPTPQEVELNFGHIEEIKALCEQALQAEVDEEDFEAQVAQCTLDEMDIVNFDVEIEELCNSELSEEEQVLCEELISNI